MFLQSLTSANIPKSVPGTICFQNYFFLSHVNCNRRDHPPTLQANTLIQLPHVRRESVAFCPEGHGLMASAGFEINELNFSFVSVKGVTNPQHHSVQEEFGRFINAIE